MKEPGQMVWERLWNRPGMSSWGFVGPNARERFAAVEAAVRADERERCAKVCERHEQYYRARDKTVHMDVAGDLAAAIRNLRESAP